MEPVRTNMSSFYVKKIKDDKSVERVLKYGRFNNRTENGKKKKTGKVKYYDGVGINIERIEEAVKDFKYIRRLFGKDRGVLAYHITVSFEDSYPPYQVDRWIKKFCDSVFNGYQFVYGIHEKGNKSHAHIVINSVCFKNGKKFQIPFPFKGDKYNAWYENMQREMDSLIQFM